MKGRIFIAWSGKNELALQVKKQLETKDYIGVVGGEEKAANGLFVGDSILDQINHCNQAIFIVQKKDDGTISNNLMFEFGYSLARFSHNKIHIFYIDIDPNDQKIPSDLKGIWADFYMTAECENVVDDIVQRFLSAQKHIIPGNKMAIVDDYYSIKSMLQRYADSPQCSEYELAQYILFYAQAAYMFNNEKESLDCLKELSKNLTNPGEEVSLALSLAICNIDFFLNAHKNGDVLYLEKSYFSTLNRRFKDMDEAVSEWEADDFTRWVRVLLYDILNYSRILYACNPEVDQARRDMLLNDSMNYANECLRICDELLESPSNRHFVELFKAYMYRNLATAQRMLGMDKKLVRDNTFMSCKMRTGLWDYYNEVKRISSKLLDSFEMEYYLAKSENLEYIDDPIELEDSREECESYIMRVKNLNLEKSHFISKIEGNIKVSD